MVDTSSPCASGTVHKSHKSQFSMLVFLEPLTQLPPCGCATTDTGAA